jgi:hypothetical protein
MQPLDLAIFGPLKTLLSGKLSQVAKTNIKCLQRHEWLQGYAVVRPVALQASNIAASFRKSGLILYAPSAVLRCLPPDPAPCQLRSTKRQHASSHRASHQLLRKASPTGPYRQVANAAVCRMLNE